MAFGRLAVGSALAWIDDCAIVAMMFSAVPICGAKNWLREELRLAHADAIIVLGGESGQCVTGAVELYRAGVTLRVPASRQDDCLPIERRLVMVGVSAERIGHECVSGSTVENMRVAREALAGQQVQSAILVTSWYHIGRVLAVFRKARPEITWGTQGVFPGDTLAKSVSAYEAGSTPAEYVGRVWYAARY